MRWLLLILVFEINGGNIRPIDKTTRVYRSEAVCNAEGNRLTATVRYPNPNWRSMSIGIPESDFRQ